MLGQTTTLRRLQFTVRSKVDTRPSAGGRSNELGCIFSPSFGASERDGVENDPSSPTAGAPKRHAACLSAPLKAANAPWTAGAAPRRLKSPQNCSRDHSRTCNLAAPSAAVLLAAACILLTVWAAALPIWRARRRSRAHWSLGRCRHGRSRSAPKWHLSLGRKGLAGRGWGLGALMFLFTYASSVIQPA
jgi:hypothetical protein